jgi:hypothetical protein
VLDGRRSGIAGWKVTVTGGGDAAQVMPHRSYVGMPIAGNPCLT